MPLVDLSRPPPHSQNVGSIDCAFCFANLDSMSVPQREIHYEDHFRDAETMPPRDNEPPQSSSSSVKATASPSSVKNKAKLILPCLRETDDFWYPAHITAPAPSFTPGKVSLFIQLTVHSSDFTSQRANLSHPSRVMQRSQSWKCQTRRTVL
jgi:hypothetical protein